MSIMFWGNQILFDHGQIAMDPSCCCVDECCSDCPRLDYTPDFVAPRFDFFIDGAIHAEGTMEYIYPSGPNRCWEYDSGPVTPTEDCGGAFGEIRLRIWCQGNAESGFQIRASLITPQGNCNSRPVDGFAPDGLGGVLPQSWVCEPEFGATILYEVFELIPGFCDPCDAGDDIIIDIFEVP